MKRILALVILLSGLYFSFAPSQSEVSNMDVIKVKMSSIARRPVANLVPQAALQAMPAVNSISAIEERIIEESHVAELPRNSDELSTSEEDELSAESEIPWDEIRSGWKEHLKTLLSDLDPQNGEEIFSAYTAENSAFEAELEGLGNGESTEVDTLIGQLENRHEDKLKQILGRHYQEVTDQHQQYNSSLQHLNRSSKHEVSVSL